MLFSLHMKVRFKIIMIIMIIMIIIMIKFLFYLHSVSVTAEEREWGRGSSYAHPDGCDE